MKLTIFGATGKTGQHLVQAALDAGHDVVAFARTPSKLGIQHPKLSIVQGDILDGAKVHQAVQGADAALSVLGPSSNKPDFIVSKGMDQILAAMQQTGVRRLVISAGAGIPDAKDTPRPINHFISFMLQVVARNVAADMQQTVDKVRASGMDWTVVRVPMLTDQPRTGNVRVGYVGNGTGPRLSRADMADFILRQAGDSTYLRQAPVISN